MQIQTITHDNSVRSFSGINLNKHLNKGLSSIDIPKIKIGNFSELTPKPSKITSVLNGPPGHPYTGRSVGGGGGDVQDKIDKFIDSITDGEGISSKLEKIKSTLGESIDKIADSTDEIIDKIIDIIF